MTGPRLLAMTLVGLLIWIIIGFAVLGAVCFVRGM